VEGEWTEPTVACPRQGETDVAIWVGIDGTATGNGKTPLIQAGTTITCVGRVAQYSAWHEVYPIEPTIAWPMRVRAGDRLWAQVSYSNGRFRLVVANLTSGEASHIDQRVKNALRQTAEWIVEAPTANCPDVCRRAALAHFSPVTFSGARATLGGHVDGVRGPWERMAISMLSGARTAAVPGSISRDGQSFTVTWRHR